MIDFLNKYAKKFEDLANSNNIFESIEGWILSFLIFFLYLIYGCIILMLSLIIIICLTLNKAKNK